MVEGAYTQQGRAHSRRLHPPGAARPALMSRAAHAVESKAVVRIEVAVSPRFRLFGSKGAVRGPGRARGCARALAAVRGGAGKQSDWWPVIKLPSRIGKAGSIDAANCALSQGPWLTRASEECHRAWSISTRK
jgi:hypothetical protein